MGKTFDSKTLLFNNLATEIIVFSLLFNSQIGEQQSLCCFHVLR